MQDTRNSRRHTRGRSPRKKRSSSADGARVLKADRDEKHHIDEWTKKKKDSINRKSSSSHQRKSHSPKRTLSSSAAYGGVRVLKTDRDEKHIDEWTNKKKKDSINRKLSSSHHSPKRTLSSSAAYDGVRVLKADREEKHHIDEWTKEKNGSINRKLSRSHHSPKRTRSSSADGVRVLKADRDEKHHIDELTKEKNGSINRKLSRSHHSPKRALSSSAAYDGARVLNADRDEKHHIDEWTKEKNGSINRKPSSSHQRKSHSPKRTSHRPSPRSPNRKRPDTNKGNKRSSRHHSHSPTRKSSADNDRLFEKSRHSSKAKPHGRPTFISSAGTLSNGVATDTATGGEIVLEAVTEETNEANRVRIRDLEVQSDQIQERMNDAVVVTRNKKGGNGDQNNEGRRITIRKIIGVAVIYLAGIGTGFLICELRHKNASAKEIYVTQSPTVPVVPSNNPTTAPTELSYGEPTDEECFAIESKEEVKGQDGMITRSYDVHFDVQLNELTTDWYDQLEEGMADQVIPDLACCRAPPTEERSLLVKQSAPMDYFSIRGGHMNRMLRSIRCVVANGSTRGEYNENFTLGENGDSCVELTGLCLPAVVTLDLTLKGDEADGDIMDLVTSVIQGDGSEPLAQKFDRERNVFSVVKLVDVVEHVPTRQPSSSPTSRLTLSPTLTLSLAPTRAVTQSPTAPGSLSPTSEASENPSSGPSIQISSAPTKVVSQVPSYYTLSETPTKTPTKTPTTTPSETPSETPTVTPTGRPTLAASANPSMVPTGLIDAPCLSPGAEGVPVLGDWSHRNTPGVVGNYFAWRQCDWLAVFGSVPPYAATGGYNFNVKQTRDGNLVWEGTVRIFVVDGTLTNIGYPDGWESGRRNPYNGVGGQWENGDLIVPN